MESSKKEEQVKSTRKRESNPTQCIGRLETSVSPEEQLFQLRLTRLRQSHTYGRIVSKHAPLKEKSDLRMPKGAGRQHSSWLVGASKGENPF